MKCAVAVLAVSLSAVVLGIFNRRWAVPCALFVIHLAICIFILSCASHFASEHQHMASPSGASVGIDRGGKTVLRTVLNGLQG